VAARAGQAAPAASPTKPAPLSQEVLAEVHPSWWGYFWYLFFFWLIVPPIIAWFRRASVVLRVHPGRITLERGLVSKCYREFFVRDIRSIDIDQGFWGRLVGVGNLTLATAATTDATEEIKGIPNPRGVRDLILAQRTEPA
jgi:uncharacterized membrane protein YdbT with pleckstrin-like domain